MSSIRILNFFLMKSVKSSQMLQRKHVNLCHLGFSILWRGRHCCFRFSKPGKFCYLRTINVVLMHLPLPLELDNRQSFANFSAILCEPCSQKPRFFPGFCCQDSLYTRRLLRRLLGFLAVWAKNYTGAIILLKILVIFILAKTYVVKE